MASSIPGRPSGVRVSDVAIFPWHSAAEVEARVACAVREHFGDRTESDDRDLIRNHVVRVELQANQLAIELKAEKAPRNARSAVNDGRVVLRIPWKKTPMKRRREVIVPVSVSPHDLRPTLHTSSGITTNQTSTWISSSRRRSRIGLS